MSGQTSARKGATALESQEGRDTQMGKPGNRLGRVWY